MGLFGPSKDELEILRIKNGHLTEDLKRDFADFEKYCNINASPHAKKDILTALRSKLLKWIKIFEKIDSKDLPVKDIYSKLYNILYSPHEGFKKSYFDMLDEFVNDAQSSDELLKLEFKIKNDFNNSFGATINPKKKSTFGAGWLLSATLGIILTTIALNSSKDAELQHNSASKGSMKIEHISKSDTLKFDNRRK